MLDLAYAKGVEEGLGELRTVLLNLKPGEKNRKMLREYVKYAVKRLERYRSEK